VVRARALDGPIKDKVSCRHCCHSFKCSVKGVQNDRTVKALMHDPLRTGAVLIVMASAVYPTKRRLRAAS
jgi:hypothetical protein